MRLLETRSRRSGWRLKMHSRVDASVGRIGKSFKFDPSHAKPKDFNFVLRGAAGDVGPHYARPRPASNTTQASQPKKCIPTPSKAEGEHPQLWQPKTSPRTAASPQKHPRTTATRAHHPRRRRPQPRLATRPRRPSKSRARPRGRALALLEAETNGVVRFKMRRVDGVLVG